MFLFIILCTMLFGSVKVTNHNLSIVEDAKSAILIEAETGTVLYEKNADEKRAPASMTKLMTMNLVLEAKNKGVVNFNDLNTISEYAASMGGSQIFLQAGEKMTVEDLFKSVAIVSANDAAVALAERIGGNEKNFVSMMNQKADELGLKNTVYKNPTGLTDVGHLTTARDMAILARHSVNTFDQELLKYTSIYEDYIRDGKFWLVATNKLIKFVDGVDGLKTGWTEEAGYCLTATMKLNGMRVIAVLMGSSSSSKRNMEITQLMQFGISTYETKTILEKGKVFQSFSHFKLKGKEYRVIASEDVKVVIKKGESEKKIEYITNYLPIGNGIVTGNVSVKYNGNTIKRIDLVLSEEVQEQNFLSLFTKIISELFY